MKCLVCRRAVTKAGTTTITLEREGATFVFKGVPAHVCPDCGEDYVDNAVAGALLASAEDLAASGVKSDVLTYSAL